MPEVESVIVQIVKKLQGIFEAMIVEVMGARVRL
jgi:hypothetical protein